MTVTITWAKDKWDITTHNTQVKTFNSEEQAIELLDKTHCIHQQSGFLYRRANFSF